MLSQKWRYAVFCSLLLSSTTIAAPQDAANGGYMPGANPAPAADYIAQIGVDDYNSCNSCFEQDVAGVQFVLEPITPTVQCASGLTPYLEITPIQYTPQVTGTMSACVASSGGGTFNVLKSSIVQNTSANLWGGIKFQWSLHCAKIVPPNQNCYAYLPTAQGNSAIYQSPILWDSGHISQPNLAYYPPGRMSYIISKQCPAGWTPYAVITPSSVATAGNSSPLAGWGACTFSIVLGASAQTYNINYLTARTWTNLSVGVNRQTVPLIANPAPRNYWPGDQGYVYDVSGVAGTYTGDPLYVIVDWTLYCYPPGSTPPQQQIDPGNPNHLWWTGANSPYQAGCNINGAAAFPAPPYPYNW